MVHDRCVRAAICEAVVSEVTKIRSLYFLALPIEFARPTKKDSVGARDGEGVVSFRLSLVRHIANGVKQSRIEQRCHGEVWCVLASGGGRA